MQITETRVYETTPDQVWTIGGGVATERIVERDDVARFYVYRYETGPLPLAFYESRFAVQEHGRGTEVVWSAEFRAGSPEEEKELATAIAGIYRDALETLATKLGAPRAG